MNGGGTVTTTWASLLINTDKDMGAYALTNLSNLTLNPNSVLSLTPGTIPGGAVRGDLTYDTTYDRLVIRDITQARLLAPAITIPKTADETVNNTDVLQNDNHLFIPVGANEVWLLLICLRYTSVGGATSLHTNLSIPAAAAITAHVKFGIVTDQPANADLTITAPYLITYYQYHAVYVGGANAGTIQLQWAQSPADPSDLIVRANSYILAHRIL